MIVSRKGAELPTVPACILIVDDQRLEPGRTLQQADVSVPHHGCCVTFYALGGAVYGCKDGISPTIRRIEASYRDGQERQNGKPDRHVPIC